MNIVKDIIRGAGGFRGVIALIAIGWGIGEIMKIQDEAKETLAILEESTNNARGHAETARQELEYLHRARSTVLEEIRAEARLDVAGDITEGKWDHAVEARARRLTTVPDVHAFPRPAEAGANPLPAVGDPGNDPLSLPVEVAGSR